MWSPRGGQRRDVGRRDVAAVVRLDVEPATWAGAMSPADELPTVAASRTWRGQRLDVGRRDVGRRDVARGRAAHRRRVGRLDVAAVARLDVEPATWPAARRRPARCRPRTSCQPSPRRAPGERRCQRSDVSRREVAAVVRLDVEPATSAGVIAAVVRLDVEPATWADH
jgi:hypothetical protein